MSKYNDKIFENVTRSPEVVINFIHQTYQTSQTQRMYEKL